MITARDPAHYLQATTTTTTPKRLLWLDCASEHTKRKGVHIAQWGLGVLGRTHFTSKRGERRDSIGTHLDAAQLWQDVTDFCRPNRRVVLWAFDLAHQIRISRALLELTDIGWKLDKIVLERTAAWALFRMDTQTMLMCDLKSWTPATFGQIARDLYGTGVEWVDSPAITADPAARATMRVKVIRAAVMQVLAWIDDEGLGQFRPTGSGQSYVAYRRKFMAHDLLVHDDVARLDAERIAMHTGRCEAWKHGQLSHGPYVEFDMTAAYCRIAADSDIPTIAVNGVRYGTMADVMTAARTHAVLAQVTINTDIPVVPTKVGGRTAWPVGTFTTWLWDPELRLVADYANACHVHAFYIYHREPALRDFARFTLDGLTSREYDTIPMARRVLKHWSRCLVGRLGLRYRTWIPFGTSPFHDLRLVTYLDVDDGTSTDMLVAGYDRFLLSDMSESPDSLPQIPSWVMSECRARLWWAMVTVGLHNVVYVDTDSMIVRASTDVDHWANVQGKAGVAWGVKGRYRRLTIHGPRNYLTEFDRKVSGLPKTARQIAPLEFTGQVMSSIKESMRSGELDAVSALPRTFIMDAPDMRRQHLPNGATAPYRIDTTQQED